MPKSCVAYNCRNRFVKGSGISFHRFPFSRIEILHQWIVSLRRKHFYPSKHDYVCSEHFTPDCFYKNYILRRQLKEDAVPTIFDFTEHLGKDSTVEESEADTSWLSKKVKSQIMPLDERKRVDLWSYDDLLQDGNEMAALLETKSYSGILKLVTLSAKKNMEKDFNDDIDIDVEDRKRNNDLVYLFNSGWNNSGIPQVQCAPSRISTSQLEGEVDEDIEDVYGKYRNEEWKNSEIPQVLQCAPNRISIMSQLEGEVDEDIEDAYGKYIASQMRLVTDLETREELRLEIQNCIKKFRFKKKIQ